MSTFQINNNIRSNFNNKISTTNNFGSGPNISAINIQSPNTNSAKQLILPNKNIFELSPPIGLTVRNKQDSQIINTTNYSKIIRIRKDTVPIRNNLYDIYNYRYKKPIEVDKFEFCEEQKISSIFSTTGYHQWFTTLIHNEPSFKTSFFDKVSSRLLSLNKDCSCRYIDFSGQYVLDKNASVNQLLSTNNKKVSKAIIDFNIKDNYINIYLYNNKTDSYVQIRLRPPLRYRPAYNDWVFDEDVTINDLLSDTEYADLVDCCNVGDFKIFSK